jgi:hypothetical protein
MLWFSKRRKTKRLFGARSGILSALQSIINSKRRKINQNQSKSIKINQNQSKSIKINQNQSKSIKINQIINTVKDELTIFDSRPQQSYHLVLLIRNLGGHHQK